MLEFPRESIRVTGFYGHTEWFKAKVKHRKEDIEARKLIKIMYQLTSLVLHH